MDLRLLHAVHSARRCAPMYGGLSPSWFLLDCRFSLSIPLGLRFRERIISLAITSRRFIRLKFWAIRHTAGLDRNRAGGPAGSFSLRLCWFCGHPRDFVSPVTTTAARITKHSGLIRRRVLSVSRAKATGANDRSLS